MGALGVKWTGYDKHRIRTFNRILVGGPGMGAGVFFRKRLVNEQVFVSFSPVEPTLVQPCGCSAWGGCQGFQPPEDVGLKP